MEEHWYYLHQNGSLIYKRTWPGEDNSDLVRKIWRIDPSDRLTAWQLVLDAISLGANESDLKRLILHWDICARDCHNYLANESEITEERKKALDILFTRFFELSLGRYLDELAKTPAGTEPNLEAILSAVNA